MKSIIKYHCPKCDSVLRGVSDPYCGCCLTPIYGTDNKVLINELKEIARQEDSPIYEADKEVDYFLRLSDVIELLNK